MKISYKDVVSLAHSRTLNHVFEQTWAKHRTLENPVGNLLYWEQKRQAKILWMFAWLSFIGFAHALHWALSQWSSVVPKDSISYLWITWFIPLIGAVAMLVQACFARKCAKEYSTDFIVALQTMLDELAKHFVAAGLPVWTVANPAWLTYKWADRVERAAHELLLARAVEKVKKEREVETERDETRKQELKGEAATMHDELAKLYDSFKKLGLARSSGYAYLYRAAEKQLKHAATEPATA